MAFGLPCHYQERRPLRRAGFQTLNPCYRPIQRLLTCATPLGKKASRLTEKPAFVAAQ
jgi:hypothetical protein